MKVVKLKALTHCSSKVFIVLVFDKHHLNRTCHVNKFCQSAIAGRPNYSQ